MLLDHIIFAAILIFGYLWLRASTRRPASGPAGTLQKELQTEADRQTSLQETLAVPPKSLPPKELEEFFNRDLASRK